MLNTFLLAITLRHFVLRVLAFQLPSDDILSEKLNTDDSIPEPILFREKLLVFNENGACIGRFSLNIDQEESDSDGPKVLYVHISHKALVDEKLSESIVTGSVTHRLKTLEEIRYESTDVPDSGKHERSMFLLRERTKYYLSVTNTVCNIKKKSSSTISFAESLGLIGESANAILLRKLARRGYEGILCLKTVLSNGKRCKNYYVTRLSQQMVNGKKMQVLIVYRNVTNHRKINVTMTLALTRAGQIIYLFWSNSKCFLHVNPDTEISTTEVRFGESNLRFCWPKDIQLHSLYLDRVDIQKSVYRSFKYQNEELRRILQDFLQALLLMKPEKTVCFAIKYFTAFGHNTVGTCTVKKKTGCQSLLDLEELFESKDFQEREEKNYFPWLGESEFYGEP